MCNSIDIDTPRRALAQDTTRFISATAYDHRNAPLVTELYYAFRAKYAGKEPLTAFFEWIVAQLELPNPQPYIEVSSIRIPIWDLAAACRRHNECDDFKRI